jgi:hypothetical protein
MIKVERLDLDHWMLHRMDYVYHNEYLLASNNSSDGGEHIMEDGTKLVDEPVRFFTGDTKIDGTRIWRDELTKTIWLKICEKFKISTHQYLERVYINQQTFGQVGYWHQDDITRDDQDTYTVIYYPSLNPKQLHKGTEFFVDGDIVEIPYMTGHAVMFPSELWHRALDTEDKRNNRMSIVFHTIHMDKENKELLNPIGGAGFD